MLLASDLACERGGRTLFSGLNFSLKRGSLLHVQGANGSGKTSLLRLLCRLSTPVAGKISWDGEDVRELREEYSAQITYIGHQPAIKDELNVLENLQTAQMLAGQPVERDQALHALGLLGIKKYAHLPARVLSQGQKRRVALARLWLSSTPLWVLDEPFNALDAEATNLLQQRIENHLDDGGMAVLTTHQTPSIAVHRVNLLVLA